MVQRDITIYEDEIPEFVERELEDLYESIYCTLARFRIYDQRAGISTYVARHGDAISSVFLFRRNRGEVKVINQQITVSDDEIGRFAQAIFSRYRSVRLVSFYAIDTTLDRFPFLHQKYVSVEENILQLPATPEQYMAHMSANFRSCLRRAEKKIARACPSFHIEVLAPSQVTEDLIRQIIGFAGARMAVKHKKAYIGQNEAGNLLRLIHSHGFVVAAYANGRLCGGSIWYSVGRRSFMQVNAHDPEFDQFMLGNQVLLRGVLHWIRCGGRECWLMGGFGTHKAKFRARSQYLESLLVYRSRLGMLVHCRRAAGAAAKVRLRRLRDAVRARASGEGRIARLCAMCLALRRSARGMGESESPQAS